MSPRFVKLSRRAAEALLLLCGETEGADLEEMELKRALKPQPVKKYVKAAQARRATKKQTKRQQTSAIREAVMRRADGKCECCARTGVLLQMDHFWGRVQVKQSERNCWALCLSCHHDKTNNVESPADWARWFERHAKGHGYHHEGGLAQRRLESLELESQQKHAVGR